MKSFKQINIILADDHEIFRDGFAVMLKKFPEIKMLDQAANGKELLSMVEKQRPDVVLTDIKMPLMDGIEATTQIQDKFPETCVIALTMFDDEHLIIDMLEAGAKGYLLKNAHKDEIISAIKAVYSGQMFYCSLTSAKLMNMIAKSKYNPYKKASKPQFSVRETEIIRLICNQLSNKEIGDKLKLSVRTVEGHRLKIQEKMNVSNTAGIVIYAIKNKIYEVN